MRTLFMVLLFSGLSHQMALASGARCIDNGTHPGQNWQSLCSAAAATMAKYPVEKQEQICQGYPGCVYIPPMIGGRCIADETHQDEGWQKLCSSAGALMAKYPGKEAQICQGYPGCVYIP